MVDISVIICIFLFCLLSFVDFIVFNEEILLTLCFLSFIFFCFNTLSDSVTSSFESRAKKFEDDLLINFNNSKDLLIANFNGAMKLQFFINKFSILMTSLLHYLSVCLVCLEYKSSWVYFQTTLVKLNELSLASKKFTTQYQKSSITKLLYSLILKKSNNDLTFLTVTFGSTQKLIELKNLSY